MTFERVDGLMWGLGAFLYRRCLCMWIECDLRFRSIFQNNTSDSQLASSQACSSLHLALSPFYFFSDLSHICGRIDHLTISSCFWHAIWDHSLHHHCRRAPSTNRPRGCVRNISSPKILHADRVNT